MAAASPHSSGPAWKKVTIRWHGGYGYVTTWTSEHDGVPVCRLEYLGLDDVWGFALHDPATYTYSLLPDGQPEGDPRDALDCAVRLHLTGIADAPIDEDD